MMLYNPTFSYKERDNYKIQLENSCVFLVVRDANTFYVAIIYSLVSVLSYKHSKGFGYKHKVAVFLLLTSLAGPPAYS